MNRPDIPGLRHGVRMLVFGAVVMVLVGTLSPPTGAAAQPPAERVASASIRLQVQPVAAELKGRTYVSLGDSIAAGKYAVAPDRTFPALIAEHLGMHLDLIARSGARAAWGMSQRAAVETAGPALVTIELGTNDVGFDTPAAVFAQQYEAIVSAVAQGTTLVVCIGSWLPSDSIDGIIRDTCARHGGVFVGLSGFYFVGAFHAPVGAGTYLGRSDWFHPGDEGHGAIASIVLSSLPGYQGPVPSRLIGEPPGAVRGPS